MSQIQAQLPKELSSLWPSNNFAYQSSVLPDRIPRENTIKEVNITSIQNFLNLVTVKKSYYFDETDLNSSLNGKSPYINYLKNEFRKPGMGTYLEELSNQISSVFITLDGKETASTKFVKFEGQESMYPALDRPYVRPIPLDLVSEILIRNRAPSLWLFFSKS